MPLFTLSVPPGTSQYYVTPTSTYQLLISVGGVIQQPDTDYTISTNTITFTTAPTAGLSFFGILMGDALNIGTPSDGTVTQSKIGTNVLTPIVSQINGGPLAGTRNRIINGAMVIDQRNAGASVTATTANLFSVDRWQAVASQSSKYTIQRNAGSVTPPVGFINYLGVTSSSAYSVLSSDYFSIQQIV